jgi:hypothetical protein
MLVRLALQRRWQVSLVVRGESMDFRMRRSTLDGLDEAHCFWALIEPVWPDASVKNELKHIALATPGQRALYVVTLCIREVCNGGLDQFFSNSSGVYAMEVRKALRLLGADEHAAAFDKALKVFPGAHVPVDEGEREALLDAIPKARRQAMFEPLEEVFSGEERIWPYFQRYIDTHPSEFFLDASGEQGATLDRRRSPRSRRST